MRSVATYALLAVIAATWLLFQDAAHDRQAWAYGVCAFGLIPGQLTHLAEPGTRAPLGGGLACEIGRQPLEVLTPVTAMFLHGGWGHLLRNLLLLWLFGRSVERVVGPRKLVGLYLFSGLAAAAIHVLFHPLSPAPAIGASGAIAGLAGAYLALSPRDRVHRSLPFPGWLVVALVFGWLLVSSLPQLVRLKPDVGGTVLWAHLGGFMAGIGLAMFFRARAARSAAAPMTGPSVDC